MELAMAALSEHPEWGYFFNNNRITIIIDVVFLSLLPPNIYHG